MELLNEVQRRELLNKAKHGAHYKTKEGSRYTARLKCSLSSSSAAYDNIDVNKLFRDDILEARLTVIGETDTYEVIISFVGVIEELKRIIQDKGPTIKLNMVTRSIIRAFDKNDVFVHCNCEDFRFRQNYWSTIERYNSGDPEMRPTDITNPDGDLGGCCKHIILVLNRQTWIIKVASVLSNYIKYMRLRQRKLYEKIIAPVLFGELKTPEEAEEDKKVKQLSIFDNEPEETNTSSEEEESNNGDDEK